MINWKNIEKGPAESYRASVIKGMTYLPQIVEAGTLARPNGVDIAPEALYGARDMKKPNGKLASRRKRST